MMVITPLILVMMGDRGGLPGRGEQGNDGDRATV
jgi:hypothetical protein